MLTNNQSTFTKGLGYIVDNFDELQDMTYDDNLLLDEYIDLKLKKQKGLAINETRLAQLETVFQNKIITSARWNKFQNCLVNMEMFLKTEVEGYVKEKQLEMQTFVSDKQNELNAKLQTFSYKNQFDSTITYKQWNIVTYNHATYLSRQDNNLNHTPIGDNNDAWWAKIASRGEQGMPGIGLTFVGNYNNAVTYTSGMAVNYNDAIYYCMQQTVGNLPTNETYWTKFLSGTTAIIQDTEPESKVLGQVWIQIL